MSNGQNGQKKNEVELAHAELESVKTEIRGDIVTTLRSWAQGASTAKLSALFAVLTALGWARDALEGFLAAIPFAGTIFSGISALLSNFDESIVVVPWSLILVELIYRFNERRKKLAK